MKRASDYRAAAKAALDGHWGKSILIGLIAVALGGATSGGNFSFGSVGSGGSSSEGSGESVGGMDMENLIPVFLISLGIVLVIFTIAFIVSLAYTFFGGIIETGYYKYNLELVDYGDPGFNHLFGYFPRWKTLGLCALLRTLYITLWTLLFIIPGIIATYNYAMTPFILAEDPTVGPNEAIERSKRLMYGHRWELFCLNFSFIGWHLLCILSCGIGYIWLTPYRYAALAEFYREISCTFPETHKVSIPLNPFAPEPEDSTNQNI